MSRDARRAAFLVVDVQHGFIDEMAELPVPDGAAVIPVINGLLPSFAVRVASQDWHPPDHGSFASRHPGAKPFDTGTLTGLPQVLWPDHCVQGTRGARLHASLDARRIQAIFRKGMDPEADSYSAFRDNAGRNPTGLAGYLRGLEVTDLVIGGLALDYCVRYSAIDAVELMPGVRVTVVRDACRPVAPDTGVEAERALREAGVHLIRADELTM